MQRSVGGGKTNPTDKSMEGPIFHSMLERATVDEDLINIRQWVAMPSAAMPRDPHQRTPRIIQEDPWRDSAYEMLISPNTKSNSATEASSNKHFTLPPHVSPFIYRRNTGPKDNYNLIISQLIISFGR